MIVFNLYSLTVGSREALVADQIAAGAVHTIETFVADALLRAC